MTPGGPNTDLPPGGRPWYVIREVGHPDEGTFIDTMEKLCRFLDDELRHRGIPWEKIVIGGFSQGTARVGAAAGLALARRGARPRDSTGVSAGCLASELALSANSRVSRAAALCAA